VTTVASWNSLKLPIRYCITLIHRGGRGKEDQRSGVGKRRADIERKGDSVPARQSRGRTEARPLWLRCCVRRRPAGDDEEVGWGRWMRRIFLAFRLTGSGSGSARGWPTAVVVASSSSASLCTTRGCSGSARGRLLLPFFFFLRERGGCCCCHLPSNPQQSTQPTGTWVRTLSFHSTRLWKSKQTAIVIIFLKNIIKKLQTHKVGSIYLKHKRKMMKKK
jgi:hypothetical protein